MREPAGKRFLDISVSGVGLAFASPVLAGIAGLIWLGDRKSPLYRGVRSGRDGKPFRTLKLRSMVQGAEGSGVDSTSTKDPRITPVGHFIRKHKLDEFTQLWNVLAGDMSLVGPRPNVPRETALYTSAERKLLSVKPGITDFASIVFADEGEILSGHADPDIAYHQLIRPGKNRLGLFYVENSSVSLDIHLILLTVLGLFSRSKALTKTSALLERHGADQNLVLLAKRTAPLLPSPPPGATEIVQTRQLVADTEE